MEKIVWFFPQGLVQALTIKMLLFFPPENIMVSEWRYLKCLCSNLVNMSVKTIIINVMTYFNGNPSPIICEDIKFVFIQRC